MTSTEGKKAEEEPTWANRLVDASEDPMVIANQEGKILFCNKALLESFGYSREELVGKPLPILMPKGLRESHQRAMRKFLKEERRPKSPLVVRGLRKDGSTFPIEWTLSSFTTEHAQKLCAIGRDITQCKQREAKLNSIQQVSRQLKLAKSKEEIYGLVMDGVKENLGYSYCAILELEGDFLEVAKERGYTSKPMGEKLALDGKGITVASLNKNQPLYIPDLQEDKRYIQGVPGARCEYAIPITIGEDKYGVLNIENKEVDSIPQEDRDLLQILASELAVALKSVENYVK